MSKKLHERLLGDVGGVVRAAEHAQAEVVERTLVPTHQSLEGGRVATAGGEDLLALGRERSRRYGIVGSGDGPGNAESMGKDGDRHALSRTTRRGGAKRYPHNGQTIKKTTATAPAYREESVGCRLYLAREHRAPGAQHH